MCVLCGGKFCKRFKLMRGGEKFLNELGIEEVPATEWEKVEDENLGRKSVKLETWWRNCGAAKKLRFLQFLLSFPRG
jgi:hypothetical protein